MNFVVTDKFHRARACRHRGILAWTIRGTDFSNNMQFFGGLLGGNSKRQFGSTLIRELRAAGDTRTCEFDEENFQLVFLENGAKIGVANLTNLYEEFAQRKSGDRNSFMREIIRSILSSHKKLPEDFADAQHDLLISVRSRSYFTLLELQNWANGNDDFSWPHLPLAEHLAIGLVFDLPESLVMIQNEQLQNWNISFYEAYEIAIANFSQLEASYAAAENRLYMSDSSDNYDASRIVLTDWIRGLDVHGEPIAMVPNRDKLLITGDGDDLGLQMMTGISSELLLQPRAISGFAFQLVQDEWQPWLPSRNSSEYQGFYEMQVRSQSIDYAHQKELLEPWLVNERQDLFVATYNVVENKQTSQIATYSIWSSGVDSLLPQTDFIAFVTPSNDPNHSVTPTWVRWEDAEKMMGEYFEKEQDFYPIRWRTNGFPPKERFAGLEQASPV